MYLEVPSGVARLPTAISLALRTIAGSLNEHIWVWRSVEASLSSSRLPVQEALHPGPGLSPPVSGESDDKRNAARQRAGAEVEKVARRPGVQERSPGSAHQICEGHGLPQR